MSGNRAENMILKQTTISRPDRYDNANATVPKSRKETDIHVEDRANLPKRFKMSANVMF